MHRANTTDRVIYAPREARTEAARDIRREVGVKTIRGDLQTVGGERQEQSSAPKAHLEETNMGETRQTEEIGSRTGVGRIRNEEVDAEGRGSTGVNGMAINEPESDALTVTAVWGAKLVAKNVTLNGDPPFLLLSIANSTNLEKIQHLFHTENAPVIEPNEMMTSATPWSVFGLRHHPRTTATITSTAEVNAVADIEETARERP